MSLDTQLQAKDVKFDRLAACPITLTNDFYDIKVKPNDLVTAPVINLSVDRLFENLLHIYSRTKMSSNNIPSIHDYKYIISETSSGYVYEDRTDFNTLSSQVVSTTVLSGATTSNIINHKLNDSIIHIINNGTSITYLSAVDVYTNKLSGPDLNGTIGEITTNSYINDASDLQFNNIVDVKIDSREYMYVADASHCTVYKYDITGITRSDIAILDRTKTKGTLLVNSIGSPGTIYENNKFQNPTNMVIDNEDNLHIIDMKPLSGGLVKKYDLNGNWIYTFDTEEEFNAYKPKDIIYNSSNNTFIVLAKNNYINIYDKDFKRISSDQIIDGPSEVLTKIIQSTENDNILYIISNNNIYKKFITRLDSTIGRFKVEVKGIGTGNPGDLNFSAASIQPTKHHTTGTNKDDIYIIDSATGIMHQFVEDSTYLSIVYDYYKDYTYSLSEIEIKGDEYVSASTYNKCISKLLTNHLVLIECIKSQFVIEYEYTGIPNLVDVRYITEDQINTETYRPKLDNFIGINEILLNSTINRAFESIYNLQLEMVKLITEHSLNSFPLDTQVISMDI
jgi:hypothetical protein